MAATLDVSCPECKKQIRVPAEIRGKKIRCKACGHTFVAGAVPAAKTNPAARAPAAQAKPAAAKTAAAPPPEDDDDEEIGTYGFADPDAAASAAPPKSKEPPPDKSVSAPGKAVDPVDANPYGMTYEDLSTRCPQCAAKMESDDAIICLKCGYNLETRQMGKVVKAIAHTPFEILLWWMPGILCTATAAGLTAFVAYLWTKAPGVAEQNPDSTLHWILGAFPMRLWGGVVCAFIIWRTIKFGFNRLVRNTWPPEKLKQL
jgi:predicted Zn finger-like uncharacterized protein